MLPLGPRVAAKCYTWPSSLLSARQKVKEMRLNSLKFDTKDDRRETKSKGGDTI